MSDSPILACEGVHKHFDEAGHRLEVLRGVELRVRQGETVAIIGESGSGKTTLLQILGGLDLPSSGIVRLRGTDFAALSEAARGDPYGELSYDVGTDGLRELVLDRVTP